jgi:glucose/arabinose dehydrogenase
MAERTNKQHRDIIKALLGVAQQAGATKEELSWPTATGRLRHLISGPDGALYVGDEASGNIYRVTPL